MFSPECCKVRLSHDLFILVALTFPSPSRYNFISNFLGPFDIRGDLRPGNWKIRIISQSGLLRVLRRHRL